MAQSPPPSPRSRTSISNSSLSPHRDHPARALESSYRTENTSGTSAGQVQTDSLTDSRKYSTTPENVGEDAPPDDRQSSIKRSDSINPHASKMSLYEFHSKSVRFHWEDSTSHHKTLNMDDTWPLKHVGELSSREKAKARVWASEVTQSKHGLTDTVADKIVKYKTEEEKKNARIEVENLRKLCHNHIVAFLGYYIKGIHLGILMFPVAAWDLEQFLESPSVGRRREIMRPWFGCLTRALLFLHTREKPFKHRDIKPANILIDISGAVFLTDFGISKEYASNQEAVTRGDGRYTIEYASPQMVQQDDQGLESDIFCLGCVFLEMATVILGRDLDEMYKCITGLTGMSGRVHYHRDFAKVSRWAEELQKTVRNRPNIVEYEKHLVEDGLLVIIRMIKECASWKKTERPLRPMLTLNDICKAFDPISPKKCISCWHKAVPETIPEGERAEGQVEPVETATACAEIAPKLAQLSQIQVEPRQRPSNCASISISSDLAGVSDGAVLHKPSSSEIKGDASLPPSIVLQRQATDLSELGDSAGRKVEIAHALSTPLESVSEGTSGVVQGLVLSGNLSSTQIPSGPPQDSITPKPSEASMMTESQPKPAPAVYDEPHRVSFPPHHILTDPISMTSTNSRIRMVDTRRKRLRIMSFDDVSDIPGAEVLVFDLERGKWRAHQKSRVPLRQGFLWRLPRGIGRKYWTPSGYLRPWKDLTAPKNFKRIFGNSMLTMFIEGRQTAAQLESLYSRENRESGTKV